MKFYIGMIAVVCLMACQKNAEQVSIDYGYSYYPIKLDTNYVYLVDSISYNDNTNTIDTFKFQLMQHPFVSINTSTITMLRFVRDNDSSVWQQRESYFIIQNKENIEVVEDGIHYVKIAFPLTNGKSWNGNQFNNLPAEIYQCQNIGKAFLVGDSLYSNTATLSYINTNAIEEIEKTSVYAKDVGLIYSMNTYINTQQDKKSGYKVSMKLR